MIRTRFQLSFDTDEIKAALERLRVKQSINYHQSSGFFVSPAKELEIRQGIEQSEGLEIEVVAAWLHTVQEAFPAADLGPEDREILRQDLLTYVSLVYHVHGADCVTFIMHDEKSIQALLKTTQVSTLDQLPDRDSRLTELRAKALPLFFKNPDLQRKIYLSGLLNSSFMLMTISGDRSMASYWRSNWKKTTFYVDTNLLLRALGFQGSDIQTPAVRVLQLASKSGIMLKVSQITLDELKGTLAAWRKSLQAARVPQAKFAELYLRAHETSYGFPTAYYEFLASGGALLAQERKNSSEMVETIKGMSRAIQESSAAAEIAGEWQAKSEAKTYDANMAEQRAEKAEKQLQALIEQRAKVIRLARQAFAVIGVLGVATANLMFPWGGSSAGTRAVGSLAVLLTCLCCIAIFVGRVEINYGWRRVSLTKLRFLFWC